MNLIKPDEAFQEWPKIARLSREIIVTEKIDGTNAQIYIPEPGDLKGEEVMTFQELAELTKDEAVLTAVQESTIENSDKYGDPTCAVNN